MGGAEAAQGGDECDECDGQRIREGREEEVRRMGPTGRASERRVEERLISVDASARRWSRAGEDCAEKEGGADGPRDGCAGRATLRRSR